LIQSEKLAAVGQLAAGVAHEINNPLAAIIANAQILLRETSPDDKDIRESLELIELAGSRASQVVKNLLGFARKEDYDFVRLDINETIQNAISLVQHEINSRQLKINLNLKDDLPPAVASKDHIQGVWINLLMNAIDAIDLSPGQITISTDYQNKEFKIVIEDNGKGIPPDKLARIFEPFYKTKSAGKGTGLGLSVCNRIIKKHSGEISAESVLGQGSKFVVTLPGAVSFKVTGSLVE
jgi:two-component system NtrC family sensor kinase